MTKLAKPLNRYMNWKSSHSSQAGTACSTRFRRRWLAVLQGDTARQCLAQRYSQGEQPAPSPWVSDHQRCAKCGGYYLTPQLMFILAPL